MSLKPLAFIVEDDQHQNEIFSLALQNDFELLRSYDGLEAMQQLEQVTPQLLVLDMNLPGASGAQILTRIRADARFDQTSIILATADAVQAAELEQYVDIVLLKPVSPWQLVSLAKRILPNP